MRTPQIYLLAGLGFDERIFSELKINDAKLNFLKWLEPSRDESLESYVLRMAAQIQRTENPLILIGHSFGGIIIQKISEFIKPQKIIIISSIKLKKEIPVTLKFLKIIPLYKYFNKKLVLASFPVWARAFGYNSDKGRILFHKMISGCTDNYFRWAMHKIVNFEENKNFENLIHIHGTRDKTFPIKLIKDPIIIKDGSHFMVYSKADDVSEILNREISKNL